MNLDNLDKQSLLLIAVEMDMPSLLNLCKSNKRINELICKKPQIWIDKLYRDFDFRFLGIPTLEREPKNYYKILYMKPEDFILVKTEYGSRSIIGKNKFDKYYVGSLFEAIKFHFNDLAIFLFQKFKGDLICEALIASIRYTNVDMVEYFLSNIQKDKKGKMKCDSKIGSIIYESVKSNNNKILKLLIDKFKRKVDIVGKSEEKFDLKIGEESEEEKIVNLAIENKNSTAIKLLSPFIHFPSRYNELIINKGDLEILKAFYRKDTSENSYYINEAANKSNIERMIVASIFADNTDFFKYLLTIFEVETYNYQQNKLDKRYGYAKIYNIDLPEKELKNMIYLMYTILSYKATKILKYLFSIGGVYNYVITEYKDSIKAYRLEDYIANLKPESNRTKLEKLSEFHSDLLSYKIY